MLNKGSKYIFRQKLRLIIGCYSGRRIISGKFRNMERNEEQKTDKSVGKQVNIDYRTQ